MKSLDLVVIGLGYVGLPIAVEACRSGLSVAGLDASEAVVNGLLEGLSHVDDVIDDDVTMMLSRGFTAATHPEILKQAKVVLICVPTPLDGDGGPDLSMVIQATTDVVEHLHTGQLVVLESTTYPGTTEEVLVPILESSGLRVGQDFHCAYSPERIDPGNSDFGVRNTPKIVGGVTPACREVAEEFYSLFVDEVISAKGTREAELAKLLENTYRHVNIALVNELAQFAHLLDIDLWDSIRCAATKPFGFQAFYPGPGVGGHCIPIDPNYLSHRIRSHLGTPFRFVELAQEINHGMPSYVTRRVQDALNDNGKALRGSRVLLLGVTYKANIADQRESPAIVIARDLRTKGAALAYADPYVSDWKVDGDVIPRATLDSAVAVTDFDIAVLLQAHQAFLEPIREGFPVPILDTRGLLSNDNVIRM